MPGYRECSAMRVDSWPRPLSVKHGIDYAELVRKMGSDEQGVAECAATAARIADADDDSWHREWFAIGKLSLRQAEVARTGRNKDAARACWRRAAIYFCAAESYLAYSDPRRPRTVEYLRSCSRHYVESLAPAGEVVEIKTGEAGALSSGYLVHSIQCDAPIVICIGDWDELKEASLPLIAPALAEGIAVLLVDLPAAGAGRHAPTTFLLACVNYLQGRKDCRKRDIVVYGIGAGATFASDAAACDERIRLAVTEANLVNLDPKRAAIRQFIGTDHPISFVADGSERGDVRPSRIDSVSNPVFAGIAQKLRNPAPVVQSSAISRRLARANRALNPESVA